MRREIPLALALALLPAALHAQAAVYQKQKNPQFHLDGLTRQEWTEELVFARDLTDRSRRLLRLRPRLELSGRYVDAGVGGDFTYGSDRNTEPLPEDPAPLPLYRDNYDSRAARLDLAWIGLTPISALRVQAGRFAMPVRFTEMIWDRDLRPQGASATLDLGQVGPLSRLAVTGVYSRGGHPLPQDKPFKLAERDRFFVGSATATVPVGQSQVELMGAYVNFTDLRFVPSLLRRQNTRPAGALALDYDVVDLVARYRSGGRVNTQLAVDYCWNTAATADNRGLWIALALGSTTTARGSLEYVYARVDKDATLAEYATDDFIWATGWAGHRGDLGLRMSDNSALHLVAQYQRFKDAPNEADRDAWKYRLRAEVRVSY